MDVVSPTRSPLEPRNYHLSLTPPADGLGVHSGVPQVGGCLHQFFHEWAHLLGPGHHKARLYFGLHKIHYRLLCCLPLQLCYQKAAVWDTTQSLLTLWAVHLVLPLDWGLGRYSIYFVPRKDESFYLILGLKGVS